MHDPRIPSSSLRSGLNIRNSLRIALTTLCFPLLLGSSRAEAPAERSGPYAQFARGPSTSENYFPIGVWLQSPANAARFKAAGFNLYVGLWRGPTQGQLQELERASMPVICAQNAVGLTSLDRSIIVGWMHDDEPDNAQSLGSGKGYGPPIAPAKIREDYERMRRADPSRPVLLNLGQGVAWDDYIGRGVRRNHPEDYAEYVQGCDVASFDIYPVVHDHRDVTGKLEFVGRGVARLRTWAGPQRTVWNCIECTHISQPDRQATPEQVRSEVWMALIQGSRGLIYFVHQFKPTFKEAALLDDPPMLAAVTELNAQIHHLAPVLNRPSVTNGVHLRQPAGESSVAWMQKRHSAFHYLFVANQSANSLPVAFEGSEFAEATEIEVLGESRVVKASNRQLHDDFKPYAVHLYRWKAGP